MSDPEFPTFAGRRIEMQESSNFSFLIWTPPSTRENLGSYLPWFDSDKKRVSIAVDQKEHGIGFVRDQL